MQDCSLPTRDIVLLGHWDFWPGARLSSTTSTQDCKKTSAVSNLPLFIKSTLNLLHFPHQNPRECCKQPKLIDDSIFAGCFERFGMNNQNFQSPQRQSFRQAPSQNQRAFRGPPPGFPSTCMAECVFNSVNLSVDQPESAGEFITKALEKRAPEWIPIFTEGFTFCTKTVTEKLSANDLAEKFDGCSPLPGAILGCLHSHVFTKCPQNVWKNGEWTILCKKKMLNEVRNQDHIETLCLKIFLSAKIQIHFRLSKIEIWFVRNNRKFEQVMRCS